MLRATMSIMSWGMETTALGTDSRLFWSSVEKICIE